jgi:putative endonuclease
VPANPRGEVGRRGEDLAALRFERLGYEVLERNYRTRAGEIDLIARKGGTLVFCEVKALVARGREGVGPAFLLEAVGPAKQAQVRQLARAWFGEHERRRRQFGELRFDAIGVLLSPAGELLELEHVEGAF